MNKPQPWSRVLPSLPLSWQVRHAPGVPRPEGHAAAGAGHRGRGLADGHHGPGEGVVGSALAPCPAPRRRPRGDGRVQAPHHLGECVPHNESQLALCRQVITHLTSAPLSPCPLSPHSSQSPPLSAPSGCVPAPLCLWSLLAWPHLLAQVTPCHVLAPPLLLPLPLTSRRPFLWARLLPATFLLLPPGCKEALPLAPVLRSAAGLLG